MERKTQQTASANEEIMASTTTTTATTSAASTTRANMAKSAITARNDDTTAGMAIANVVEEEKTKGPLPTCTPVYIYVPVTTTNMADLNKSMLTINCFIELKIIQINIFYR